MAPATSQVNLPTLGEAGSDALDIGAERRLGDQVMREIRSDPDYLDDPLLLDHVNAIWSELVATSRRLGNIGPDTDTRFAWQPFLIRDRTINAFALPGGYIGVYLGMVALTATPDELASVMAHELSHVTQHHIARGIEEQGRTSLAAMAAMIIGLIAASRSGNGDAAQAVIMGSQAAVLQGQLNFARGVEREADRVGYDVLVHAGFQPGSMASMFEKLDYANRINDAGQFPYLRTHPLTIERITDARLRAVLAKPPDADVPASGIATLHVLMQARARVLMNRAESALRTQQALGDGDSKPGPDDQANRERLAALYGSAMASSALRDFSVCDQRIVTARQFVAKAFAGNAAVSRLLDLLAVDSLVARGDGAAALEALRPMQRDASRPAMLLRAQAAALPARSGGERIAANEAARADLQELQAWVSTHPGDAPAWGSLSQLAQAQGYPLRALRAEAESFAALGDVNGAIDRLRAAQHRAVTMSSLDFVDLSIIDSRLRDLEAQRRELIKESRNGRG